MSSAELSHAIEELTALSRMSSQAHTEANLFRDLHIDAADSSRHELRERLGPARTVLARWALLNAYLEVRTVDLARVEHAGDWEGANNAERGIGDLATELFMDGEINGMIERDTPEAKLRISLDPTIVGGNGLIVVRRKRLMLASRPHAVEFVDVRRKYPTSKTAQAHLEIDKVSEFILDIEGLREVDRHATAEVRAAAQRGLPVEVTAFRRSRVPGVIEDVINERHESMVPAVTTYYADRKYTDIRDADEAIAELVEV